MATNGVAFLRYEAHCYAQGLATGVLVVPEGNYLSMGEACDYARLHRERLVSPSHVRWREACLVPGRDYATDLEGFASRAAAVARSLVTPLSPPASVAAPRARRVLQDLGMRLCHGAALEGDPTRGFSAGLAAIADGLRAIDAAGDDAAVEDALQAALEGAAADLSAVPAQAAQILAVGYRPTLNPEAEPEAMRAARVSALHRRARAVRSPLTPLLARSPSLSEAIVQRPRSAALVVDTALAAESLASRGGDEALVAAFTGWLTLAAQHWGPEYAAPLAPALWTYRLGLREMPAASRFDEVRIRPNPYLTSLPSPFDVTWLDGLQSDALPLDGPAVPRPARGVGHALMGQGRVHPIFLACTPSRQGLLNRLQHTPSIRELLDAGVSQEDIAAALEEELIVALQHREPVPLQVAAADGQHGTGSAGAAGGDLLEDPGPWEAPDQAAYYDSYCQRSSLYGDLAEALVEAAGLEADHAVVDLGCGTGVSTAAALGALGPEGSVLAIDPAPRMIARAREVLDDTRVRFETGTARRLVQVGGPYDRVLCNSAIWLDPHVLVPCKAAQMVLVPGGRLAFSLPAEFLGHADHWSTDTGQVLTCAIRDARDAQGVSSGDQGPVTPTPHADYLGSVDRLQGVLRELGFAEVTATLHIHPWTVGDYLDWLGQPVALGGTCPGSPERQAAFLGQ
ncbi:MAG: class I SAM-dependent methyltransferase, partial [Myxococcota bacterium]|nr:class I SAM-dependent methyltransferase [Myxococcota bacterium]